MQLRERDDPGDRPMRAEQKQIGTFSVIFPFVEETSGSSISLFSYQYDLQYDNAHPSHFLVQSWFPSQCGF